MVFIHRNCCRLQQYIASTSAAKPLLFMPVIDQVINLSVVDSVFGCVFVVNGIFLFAAFLWIYSVL